MSTRYAPSVLILIMLALIPTIIHNYLDLKTSDNLSADQISHVIGSYVSKPTQRKQEWGEDTFSCYDWIERIYTNQQGKSVRLFVGRSYDHKRLYHHPELALSYGKDLRKIGEMHYSKQPNMHVNLLANETRPVIAAYTLLYDKKFVENALSYQLMSSIKQLISPRKPMTLFYVEAENTSAEVLFNETDAAFILEKAIIDFLEQLPT
jgi:hypothetical protein